MSQSREALPGQSPFARLALTHALAVGADTLVAVALAGSIFFSATLAAARPKVLLYLGITMVPVAAGLQTLVGARWVLRLAAVVNLVSVVAAFRIPGAGATARPAQAAEQAELHGASIRLAATAMIVLRSAVGFLTFLAAFDLKRSHAASWLFGLVIGAGALGGFLGAVIAPRLRRVMREETILVGSLLVPAVVTLFGARAFGNTAIGVVACAVAVGAASGRLAFDSLVQRDAPEAARGRTFARFETRFQLAWVGGAVIPAAIPDLPGRLGFLLLAVGLAFFGLSYFGAVRASRSTEVVSG